MAKLRLLIVCFLAMTVMSCAQKTVVAPIPTNFAWSVKDPLLSRFTGICNFIELKASGTFKKGSCQFKGLRVSTDDDTSFSLDLKIPIDNPERIEFSKATGVLSTSRPISLAGIPLPLKLTLQPGTAIADINIMDELTSFMLNTVTSTTAGKPAPGEDSVRSLIKSLVVSSLKLNLIPAKPLDFGNMHLVTGQSSTVELTNLQVDDKLDFKGQAKIALNLGDGCRYNGKKAEFAFDGGVATFLLNLSKQAQTYTFSLEKAKSTARLKNCTYVFGKVKQCKAKSAVASVQINNFICNEQIDAGTFDLKTDSTMQLETSDLIIENARKTFTLNSVFPKKIPAFLDIAAATDKDVAVNWYTKVPNEADKLTVDIHPNTSTTVIEAGKTKVGPVTLSKEGELDFSFEKGISALRSLKWSNGKKNFKMACAAGSAVSIPPGMCLNVYKDATSTKTELPLNLQVGKATVTVAKGDLELSNMRGNVKLVVDNGTTLSGGLRFALDSCDLLGQNQVDFQTDGLAFIADKSGSRLKLDKCTMSVTNDVLTKILREQIPDHKSFEVNKVLLEKQKWRYKDALLKNVEVSNLEVGELEASAPGTEKFAVKGKVAIDGTIKKGGILSVIKKQKSEWDVKEWSATGDAEGTGILKYVITPQEPLTKSTINYELTLNMTPTKNVDLDWSKVDDGVLSKAENSIITKFISSYNPKSYVKKANFSLFKSSKKKFENIRIKSITTAPLKDGLSVSFSAQIAM